MDRRKFLKVSGAAGATAMWGGSLACTPSSSSSDTAAAAAGTTTGAATPAAAASFPLASVGLQLYTVRTLAEKNLEETLQQVASAGYRLVETHTNYGKTPSELRALLDKNGLRSPSGHYGLAEIEGKPDTVIATAKALGQEYVVLNWLDPDHRSAEFYKGFPALLNKFGAQAKAAGLGFAHHNHDFEFEKVGGTTPVIETVIADTDPALVSFEVDLYWVYKAGVDPLAFVEKYPGRVSMIHIKDSTAAPAKAMADVGKGVIDFGKVLVAAKKTQRPLRVRGAGRHDGSGGDHTRQSSASRHAARGGLISTVAVKTRPAHPLVRGPSRVVAGQFLELLFHTDSWRSPFALGFARRRGELPRARTTANCHWQLRTATGNCALQCSRGAAESAENCSPGRAPCSGAPSLSIHNPKRFLGLASKRASRRGLSRSSACSAPPREMQLVQQFSAARQFSAPSARNHSNRAGA